MAASQRTDVDGVMFPDAFYTTRGITRALGIGQGEVTEWIKRKVIKPVKCGRGYGFWGRDVLKAVEAESAKGAA